MYGKVLSASSTLAAITIMTIDSFMTAFFHMGLIIMEIWQEQFGRTDMALDITTGLVAIRISFVS